MRVLVVADNVLARTGLAALLSQEGFTIVGQVAGGLQLGDDVDIYRPDAVIVDLGYDPVLSIPHLAQLDGLPVVALLPDSEHCTAAAGVLVENGAYGLLLSHSSLDMLTTALHAVNGGLVVLDPPLAGAMITSDVTLTEPPTDELTPREVEVLQLLAEGLPNKIIAQRLKISPNTVKFHINAILNKLSAQSRTEAVVRATRLGLVIL
jgi:two-component system, NarL family, nitrate/nitrite response regulator NarL